MNPYTVKTRAKKLNMAHDVVVEKIKGYLGLGKHSKKAKNIDDILAQDPTSPQPKRKKK